MEQNKKEKSFLRPKSEDEYVKIWIWKISRRLSMVLAIIAAIASTVYVAVLRASLDQNDDWRRTYEYDSFFLKLVSGHVRIKAEAGYIAYEGDVDKGSVSGTGILYGRNGNIIYSGEFMDNEYSGNGTLYDENEVILYEGEFKHNVYEGEGSEYGIGGTIKYQGTFHNGKWNGKGILSDDSGNRVYEGNFLNGAICYSDFLGRTTEDAAKMYTGKRDIYYDASHFVVDMKDIGAMYSGDMSENGLEDKVNIYKVFVKGESCTIGGRTAENIEQVKEMAGDSLYEGNVYISAEEAVALSSLSGLQVNAVFDDAMEITGYDKDKLMYIYTFKLENLQYTFYSEIANGRFIMYSVERLNDERQLLLQ